MQEQTGALTGVQVRAELIDLILTTIRGDTLTLIHRYKLYADSVADWIPLEHLIALMSDIKVGHRTRILNLSGVGILCGERLDLPATVTDQDSLLKHLNDIFAAYHHAESNGHWVTCQPDRACYRFQTTGLYPPAFEYGLIHGLVNRFCAVNVGFELSQQCRDDGTHQYTLTIL